MADNGSESLFILVDGDSSAAGVTKFAGIQQITVEKLKEHLKSFVDKVAGALTGVATEMGAYQLTEIEVEASFSAEAGFVFVAKTGVEGAVKFKFVRK